MTLTNDAAASAQLAICHREMCQGRPAAVLLLPVNTVVPIGAISAGTHRVSGKESSTLGRKEAAKWYKGK